TRRRVLLSPVSGTAVERGGSVNDMYEAERGLFELRRRRVLLVTHARNGDRTAGGDALMASAEGLTEETMASLRCLSDGPLHLVVTPHRARALGIQLAAGPLAMRLPDEAGPGDVLHLCSECRSGPPRGMT